MEKKEVIRQFQEMRAKAYSSLSLKRPLTSSEFKEYKEAFEEAFGIGE